MAVMHVFSFWRALFAFPARSRTQTPFAYQKYQTPFCYLPDVKTIKEAEVMFICGDIVPLEIQNDIKKSRIWFYNDFLNWTNSLPVDKVFIIGGNHDFFLEHLLNNYNAFQMTRECRLSVNRVFANMRQASNKLSRCSNS